jgi:glycosyltransferase involved in cell wall biosynthesis
MTPEIPSHAPDEGDRDPHPVVSVVVSTYNRADMLGGALASVLAQGASTPPFEVLVVDNNSTDGTAQIIREAAARDHRVRGLFEPRQGLSHARNAGIAAARGRIVTFTDDDVRAEADWIAAIVRAFEEWPDVAFVGGKVLPDWPTAPPPWLTRDHWAPLALADYGERQIRVSPDQAICLVGANLSVRRDVFDRVGLFEADLQRVKDGIGSCEDHEFQLRCHRAGVVGLYDPRIVIHADVQPNRLERDYHRRWHNGHGHFQAVMRDEHLEHSRLGTVWGVPAHLYRQAARELAGWALAVLRHQPERAFAHELRWRYFRGFWRTRRRQRRDAGMPSIVAELALLARRVLSRPRASDAPAIGVRR